MSKSSRRRKRGVKDGSEPTNARGNRDILRVMVGLMARLVVMTGSLESDRYDSMKVLFLFVS